MPKYAIHKVWYATQQVNRKFPMILQGFYVTVKNMFLKKSFLL